MSGVPSPATVAPARATHRVVGHKVVHAARRDVLEGVVVLGRLEPAYVQALPQWQGVNGRCALERIAAEMVDTIGTLE